MFCNNDNLRQMPLDNDIDINITNQNVNTNTNTNTNVMDNNMGGSSMGIMSSPIIETPRERCVYRNIYHEVPQDYPFMSYELMINKYKLKSYYEIIFTFIITFFILIFHP